MICSPDVPTSQKGLCYCGPSYPFRVERDFLITQWNLGPYQEYRCSYCGNMGLYDTERKRFMVQVYKRPAFIVDPERACK
jgi:hypothetical protein